MNPVSSFVGFNANVLTASMSKICSLKQKMEEADDYKFKDGRFDVDATCFPAIEIMETGLQIKTESPPPILDLVSPNLDPNGFHDNFPHSSLTPVDFDLGVGYELATNQTKTKKRLKHYSLAEKLVAVELAERTSNNNAAREFNVDRKCIREWRKSKEKLVDACQNFDDGNRKRQRGGGKKPLSNELEKRLLDWVERQLKTCDQSEISSRILKLKAIEIFNDLKSQGKINAETFKGSDGWLEKFMKRHSASFRAPKIKSELNN